MQFTEFGIATTATIALVQILKVSGLSKKYAPLVSLIIGVGTTMLFLQSASLTTIAIGIITGLSASGLYSGTKTVATKK